MLQIPYTFTVENKTSKAIEGLEVILVQVSCPERQV